jgi:hypothetical protein
LIYLFTGLIYIRITGLGFRWGHVPFKLQDSIEKLIQNGSSEASLELMVSLLLALKELSFTIRTKTTSRTAFLETLYQGLNESLKHGISDEQYFAQLISRIMLGLGYTECEWTEIPNTLRERLCFVIDRTLPVVNSQGLSNIIWG